ncbi:MAG: hypothetical protein AAGF83_20480 [Cyanobacteria bacterium P01_G01_bin.67]
MYSWGAFDKYHPEIDRELEQLKLQLATENKIDFKTSDNKKSIDNPAPQNQSKNSLDNLDNIDEILKELNRLIGLKKLKSEINNLIDFLKIQQKRQEFGLSKVPITLLVMSNSFQVEAK